LRLPNYNNPISSGTCRPWDFGGCYNERPHAGREEYNYAA